MIPHVFLEPTTYPFGELVLQTGDGAAPADRQFLVLAVFLIVGAAFQVLICMAARKLERRVAALEARARGARG